MPTASETGIISKNIDYIKSHSPQLKIPLHTYDYFNLANDKQKILELVAKLQIPTPKTYYPHSAEEVINIAEGIRYPVVIKNRLGSGGLGMNYMHSSQEMIPLHSGIYSRHRLCGDCAL
jgi:biotin carboxylase